MDRRGPDPVPGSGFVEQAAPVRRMMPREATLLGLHGPHPVPIGGWGVGLEVVATLDVDAREPIVGVEREGGLNKIGCTTYPLSKK